MNINTITNRLQKKEKELAKLRSLLEETRKSEAESIRSKITNLMQEHNIKKTSELIDIIRQVTRTGGTRRKVKRYKKFKHEQKLAILGELSKGELSIGQLAQKHNVPYATLLYWKKTVK